VLGLGSCARVQSFSGFDLVPERHFGIATLTNSSPNGGQFNEEMRRWALENYGDTLGDEGDVEGDAKWLASATSSVSAISSWPRAVGWNGAGSPRPCT
jgi:hypothetical protein